MKIGCCVKASGIESAKRAGYDYVELPAATVLPEATDVEWKPIRQEIAKHAIKPEAWNVLLPAQIQITGPDVDWHRIRKYLTTAFERIAQVGGHVVVFGSGKARHVPDHFPMEEARRQLMDFISTAGDEAHENALRLAIEPLNNRESNVINSISEALAYAEMLNHPSIGVLADFYHMDEQHEPFSAIVEARHYLMHVHTADTGRRYPGSGGYDYVGFFDALRSAGYNDRVSVECVWGDDSDVERSAALEFLRRFDRSKA